MLSPLGLARLLATISAVFTVSVYSFIAHRPGWPGVLTLGALVASAVVSRFELRYSRPVILATACLWPLAGMWTLGVYDPATLTPWIAALLGMIVATSPARRWSLPQQWQAPIAAWSVVLALGAPIVVLRELDFTLATLAVPDVANSVWPVSARDAAASAAFATAADLAALLFLDWLWFHYGDARRERLVREIVMPATGGLTAAMVVAVCQRALDVAWLGIEPWRSLGRATGTFFDANAMGSAAALWGAVAASAAMLDESSRMRKVGVMLAALTAGAVVVSGSRTALLALVVTSGSTIFTLARMKRSAIVFFALLLVGLILAAGVRDRGSNAVRRLTTALPADRRAVGAFFTALRQRDGYGAAAERIIAQNPLVGVGPGAFRVIVSDEASLATGRPIPPDNAQNWWRHVVAELGILGSVGPLLCCLLLLKDITRTATRRAATPFVLALAGAVTALGMVSVVGVPTFHPIVLQFVVLLIFWFTQSAAVESRTRPDRAWQHRAAWIVVWAIPAIWGMLTVHAALTTLRPANRAARAGWTYPSGR